AVITAPTRELAMQLYERTKLMVKASPELKIKLITGGIDRDKMADSMKQQPHIIVGTPGRIKDLFLEQKVLRVDTAKIVVVDEADMTLEYGFLEDVDQIVSRMDKKLQMMCFSATIPNGLKIFFKKYMSQPKMIKVENNLDKNPNIDHILINCRHASYEDTMLNLLSGFNPYVCLIFANTRDQAKKTADLLRRNDYRVIELHGGLEARKRAQALKQLASLDHAYIVASDIAARGIDVKGISHVISLGFPSEEEFYIHRAGRTGRAGQHGICYALYKQEDDRIIRDLIKQGVKFQHVSYKNGEWKSLNPYEQPRSFKNDLREKEISKAITRKKEKVKPGYKKKKAAEVKRIKQRERQLMIKQSIKEQKKEKYRESAKKMADLD
ncbi:MAG: DEAD/DEAH box helicase, partial [Erysipelotrichaceae bacterium]